MLIKPKEVNNSFNRFLEHLGVSMVTFVGSYLAILYFLMKGSRRHKSSFRLLNYLLDNPWAYVAVCGCIVVLVNIVFFIKRYSRKNVCALEFKDDTQEVIIYTLSYYSNQPKAIHISYNDYTLEVVKKTSSKYDKYLLLSMKQNGVVVASLYGIDSYWSGQKKYIDAIIKKSVELGKREINK